MAADEPSSKWCFLGIFLVMSISGSASEELTTARLLGFRLETINGRQDPDRVVAYWERPVTLRLFHEGLDQGSWKVSFTQSKLQSGENCDDYRTTDVFFVEADDANPSTALVTVEIPKAENPALPWMFCIKEQLEVEGAATGNGTVEAEDDTHWVHQGTADWMKFFSEAFPEKKTLLPLWLQIMMIILLLCFSGLFSGLNLGLMSLDKTDLQILQNSGSTREKRYAKVIAPVRARGNFLLCTILLGNVLVNNTLAILMDDLTGSGLAAVVGATAGIVVFGEIIPQAVCSRHGLAIGAKTIWFTRIFMIITFPMSFPISKILDLILGEEIGNVYNRDRLRELLKVTEQQMDLVKDEVQIITGALELSKKTVRDVMTKLDDVYMIEYNSILNFETMSEILKTGYTRIPVYEKERSNIVAILNIKDLAFIDPDDKTPVTTVCKFYNHPVNFVYDDTNLQVMLEEFKKGKFHMSFVQIVNDSGPGDPYYETLGVVTLEDVIEEIIQAEIVDETDTVFDNRSRAQRVAQARDFSVFLESGGDNAHYKRISPQLTLATFQFLSTTIPAFNPDLISEGILRKLLKQNVIMEVNLKGNESDPDAFLYTRGKAVDFFAMILEGRVEVSIGKENMIFEGGPFMYFGEQALAGASPSLSQHQSLASISSSAENVYQQRPIKYIPDFSVRAITNVVYLRIRRPHYIAACRATTLEKSSKRPEAETEDDLFHKEWQRAISCDPDHPTLDRAPGRVPQVEINGTPEDAPLPDGDTKRLRSSTVGSTESDRAAADVETPLMCDAEQETKNEVAS